MMLISSPSNPRISKVQDLHTARGRKKSKHFLMEGPHLLAALLDAHLWPHEVYYQPELLQQTAKGRDLLNRFSYTTELSSHQLVAVSQRVIEAISEVQTSQGVVSVLPLDSCNPSEIRRRRTQLSPTQRPILLVLDDLADPGNMGTILRTALATNVDSVLLTPDCVDYYNPKVVRAAAGAHIALPVESDLSWSTIAEKITAHCSHSPRVLVAEAGSSHVYYEQDLTHPFALIIGNEAHGLSNEAHALATSTITIPLSNGVESLNAAIAAGVILYEAVRQGRTHTRIL